MTSLRQLWVTLLCLPVAVCSSRSAAETASVLETADTRLELEAGIAAPKLVTLRSKSHTWRNLAGETLIPTAGLVDGVESKSLQLDWKFNPDRSHSNKNLVSFVYETISPKLRLTWEWEARSGRGPIEHEIRIENLDSRELWLPLQNSLGFDWQVPAETKIDHFYVEKGADTPSPIGTHSAAVAEGYHWEGTSSTYAHPWPGEWPEIIPYFLVEETVEGKPGWYTGIEFSGRTHLTLTRTGDSLRGEVGLNPNPGPFRTRLMPGESFETPRVFLGATSGGPDAAGNVLRRWVRDVLANQDTWKDPHYPLAVNNSWGGGMNVDEAIALRMIRDSAELGLEMFHIDAGWFRGVGDWHPNPKKFPHGLRPIADDAHARGLKFGLWVDWTQAALDTRPGALNARDPEVRKWLTTDLPGSWKPEEFKGQTIDIGAPKAKAWAMRETDRIVTDYKLDMLEHDGYLVAQGCEATDHPHAPPDPLNKCTYRDAGSVFFRSSNSTDVSYHAVRAYYDIYASLRHKHPALLLEICNDGGRMVDFGSAAHGDYFSITDTYDPLSNRRAFYDTSYVLPPAMLESYVERWPTPKIENFLYMLRSGMMGWLTIMLDTTSWSEEQHRVAREEFQLYKTRLRPLIREASLYHISGRPDGVRWDGMEYFDPNTGKGVVFAFRGSIDSEPEHRFFLQGLRADARYQLRFHDRQELDRIVEARELMEKGLAVYLAIANSSEIVFLEEVPPQARSKVNLGNGPL